MDEGLGHLHINRFSLTDEQVVGFVDQEAVAPLSSPNAHSSSCSASAKASPIRLTEGVLPLGQRITRTSRSLEVSHASPLAPLRSRDSRALDELFEHERLPEITLDVHRYLARTYPEPCWEDDPYEFLHGYI